LFSCYFDCGMRGSIKDLQDMGVERLGRMVAGDSLKPKPRWDPHANQIASLRVSPWLWFSSSPSPACRLHAVWRNVGIRPAGGHVSGALAVAVGPRNIVLIASARTSNSRPFGFSAKDVMFSPF